MGTWLDRHWLFCFHWRLGIHPNRGTARISAILRQPPLDVVSCHWNILLVYIISSIHLFSNLFQRCCLLSSPTFPPLRGYCKPRCLDNQNKPVSWSQPLINYKLSLQTVQAGDTIMQQSIQPSYYVIIKATL